MSIREETIKNYFEGVIPIASLIGELKNSVQQNGNEIAYDIENFKSNTEFQIKKKHLLLLCQAYLNAKFEISDLTKFAFILRSSDYFVWNNSEGEGSIVNDLITNWENPEINGELTKEYIQYCAYYLETGEHR
jgi:hypothetical protein